jgi:hypothetical protein
MLRKFIYSFPFIRSSAAESSNLPPRSAPVIW